MDDTAKHALFVLLVLSLSRRICSASEFITYNNKTLARFTRQTCRNWDKSKFHCFSSNDCVNLDLKCDGKEDCPDGSDESDITCKNFPCYGYLFRCDYGACISSDERCNGERNCRDNSDEKNCGIISRTAGNCRSDQFECEDSTCIDIYLKCDGIGNCPDNSDETEENCLNFFCPGYAYKCKYGGCVDGDSRCNGVKNCIDNSDEENCVDTIPTSTSTILFPWAECVTPPHPGDGSWHYQTSGRKGNPNTPVDAGTVIVFKCSENYKLNTTNEEKLLISCEDNGKWSHKFPSCERLCPAIYNVPHTTVSCRSKADSVIPCDKATDLTFMTFKCDPFYEPAQGIPSRIFCYKGTWSNTPKCVEVCGQERVEAEPLIVNGSSAERGKYPWTVALYSNRLSETYYGLICGGSLLTTNVVLTAAHCITDVADGTPYKLKHFKVAAGKYYKEYGSENDSDTAQYSEIAEAYIHRDYRGQIQNFLGDIALLKLKTNLVLSRAVQPICFDELPDLEDKSKGWVTGWGYTTATGPPSDVLKVVELPYTDNQQCFSELDKKFAQTYFTNDKICAGFLNQNTSVCKGDSGGGLVFKNKKYNERFYIHGIVSLSNTFAKDSQIHCNVQSKALFTKVTYYFAWIQRMLIQWSRNG